MLKVISEKSKIKLIVLIVLSILSKVVIGQITNTEQNKTTKSKYLKFYSSKGELIANTGFKLNLYLENEIYTGKPTIIKCEVLPGIGENANERFKIDYGNPTGWELVPVFTLSSTNNSFSFNSKSFQLLGYDQYGGWSDITHGLIISEMNPDNINEYIKSVEQFTEIDYEQLISKGVMEKKPNVGEAIIQALRWIGLNILDNNQQNNLSNNSVVRPLMISPYFINGFNQKAEFYYRWYISEKNILGRGFKEEVVFEEEGINTLQIGFFGYVSYEKKQGLNWIRKARVPVEIIFDVPIEVLPNQLTAPIKITKPSQNSIVDFSNKTLDIEWETNENILTNEPLLLQLTGPNNLTTQMFSPNQKSFDWKINANNMIDGEYEISISSIKNNALDSKKLKFYLTGTGGKPDTKGEVAYSSTQSSRYQRDNTGWIFRNDITPSNKQKNTNIPKQTGDKFKYETTVYKNTNGVSHNGKGAFIEFETNGYGNCVAEKTLFFNNGLNTNYLHARGILNFSSTNSHAYFNISFQLFSNSGAEIPDATLTYSITNNSNKQDNPLNTPKHYKLVEISPWKNSPFYWVADLNENINESNISKSIKPHQVKKMKVLVYARSGWNGQTVKSTLDFFELTDK